VRYGIISDIHSNLPALERVLATLAEADIDTYLCLGDIVGYSAWPNECCELVRDIGAICIRGNHDEAILRPALENWFNPEARACLSWTRAQLREVNRDFLAALEPSMTLDDMTICHGSIPDPNHYITSPHGALPSFAAMPGRLAFFGHTHYAEWFVQGDAARLPEQHASPGGGTCVLKSEHRYLINPGAVGQPRDDNPQAAFAIYDESAARVELHRVDYDIATVQRQMAAAGLPLSMSLRLSIGI